MYAIVNIAGQQFKVEEGMKLFVHRLPEDSGSKVSFEDVLLVANGGDVRVGKPKVESATVEATVVDHLKDDKVIVFKKKRRKGYKRKKGHRQYLSELHIDKISV